MRRWPTLRRRAILPLLGAMLSACLGYAPPSEQGYASWQHAGQTSELEFMEARYTCIVESTETVWTGGQASGARQATWVNEGAYLRCMEARGWVRRVPEP
ncbi:MAG: hypothetical protein ACE5FG_09100 [Myxococcota bacterium]